MTNLLLDTNFSSGLLWSAYKDGWIGQSAKDREEIERIGESGVKSIIEPRRSSRFVEKALELALIYDKVSLSGLPDIFRWDRLQNEGLIVSATGHGRVPAEVSFSIEYLYSRLKPLENYIYKRYLTAIKLLNRNAALSAAHARIITRAGLSLLQYHDINNGEDLFHFYRQFGQLFDSKQRVDGKLDLYEGVVKVISAVGDKISLDYVSMALALVELFKEVLHFIRLDSVSKYLAVPYASPAYKSMHKDKEDQSLEGQPMHDAYQLCCISMHEIVNYSPVVRGFDDVLRLREDRRIGRFREALKRWSAILRDGEEKDLAEIKE